MRMRLMFLYMILFFTFLNKKRKFSKISRENSVNLIVEIQNGMIL